ncbi:hypothetical protein R2083_05400 [Nitrosomonas sp. Is35]|uniref:hypothetical protein n=1 Tax=Nitrosomonas sp. Is35 TaxID=3080534 RepID=UPI00294B6628|nr:hypothetical protein [Nitrosomonas sp. Is35]MDV6346951.1 hypothetical protein [Nitrosomonas sp. Is35]
MWSFLLQKYINSFLQYDHLHKIIYTSVENVQACLIIEPDRTKQIDWEAICFTLILLLFVAHISWRFFKEKLINSTNGMKHEAHGTQQPLNFDMVDDGTSAAQRGDSLVQSVDRKDTKLIHIVYILLLVPTLLFLLLFLIYEDNYPTHTYGEPFLLFEGVSVWPNLVIRFAGIMIMILLFICHFRPDREGEIEAIEKKYELCKTTCLRSWQEAVWKGPFLNLTEEKSTDIADLWSEYKRVIQFKESRGYLWVFLTSSISLALTLYAFWELGYLNFPARGVITLYGHYFLVTLQFFLLWGLIFWVAYEAIACKQLIEGIELDQTRAC